MGRLNRRIPNELRKRTAQSCDLCKTRRCKCVPSGEGKTCVSCLDQGVECQYTTPRKQRFYGSLDDLSDRYRCLEAIIKGVYPNDATTTTDDLVQLGRRLGCDMPDLSSPPQKDIKIETLVREPESHFPAVATQSESSKRNDREHNVKRPDDSTAEDQGSADNETPSPAVFKDPSGNEHYIGPSGSLNFLHQLRHVFMSTKGPPTSSGHQGIFPMPSLSTAETLESEHPGSNTSDGYGATQDTLANWQAALALLPRGEILEPLIEAYFRHTHEDFPLFHRQQFEDQYHFFTYGTGKSAQPSQRTDYPTPDWGWLGSLYMITVFGSIAQPELGAFDHNLLQKQYVAASRFLLPQLIAKCSLNNLRALILLAMYLHNSNERNASWNLTGTAIRMAFAIGLHRKGQNSPSSAVTETDVRVLVLSTLYSFELFLASNLGRPSGLSETDIEIFPLPAAPGHDGSGTDPELISLTVGLNSILQRTRLMYARRKRTYGGNSDSPFDTGVDDIQDRLQRWRKDLMQYPRFDLPTITVDGRTGSYQATDGPEMTYENLRQTLTTFSPAHLRAVLMLHVQFHYIGIITTRHFLLHDIAAARLSSKGKSESISTLAQSCVLHSHQLSYIFIMMDSFQLVNGRTGFDVFYGYWAGMLLNLMLLWPRPDNFVPDPDRPCQLGSLVRQVHDVVTRVEKSGTMQRLSSVMDAFVAWADRVEDNSATSPAAPQHNGFTALNGPAQSNQQQQPATASGSGPPSRSTANNGHAAFTQTGPNFWNTGQNGTAPPMLGPNIGLAQLPAGSNGATAFLNSFLGPDDQAAMLGMVDVDFDAQSFGMT